MPCLRARVPQPWNCWKKYRAFLSIIKAIFPWKAKAGCLFLSTIDRTTSQQKNSRICCVPCPPTRLKRLNWCRIHLRNTMPLETLESSISTWKNSAKKGWTVPWHWVTVKGAITEPTTVWTSIIAWINSIFSPECRGRKTTRIKIWTSIATTTPTRAFTPLDSNKIPTSKRKMVVEASNWAVIGMFRKIPPLACSFLVSTIRWFLTSRIALRSSMRTIQLLPTCMPSQKRKPTGSTAPSTPTIPWNSIPWAN